MYVYSYCVLLSIVAVVAKDIMAVVDGAITDGDISDADVYTLLWLKKMALFAYSTLSLFYSVRFSSQKVLRRHPWEVKTLRDLLQLGNVGN